MKKKRTWKGISLALLLAFVFSTGCAFEVQVGNSETVDETMNFADPEDKETTETDNTDEMNLRAQDDYYGFINYDRLLHSEVKYGHGSAGSFDDVADLVDEELDSIIDDIVAGTGKYKAGSDEQLVYDLYWQTINDMDRELYANQELKNAFDRIQAASTIEELIETAGALRLEYGCDFMYIAYAETAIYDNSKNSLSLYPMDMACERELEDIFEERSACNGLKLICQDILSDFFVEKEDADVRSDKIVYLMLDIAAETDFSFSYADNPYAYAVFMTNEELKDILENVSIETIEKSFQITNPYGGWYLYDEKQLMAIDQLMTDENLQAWKDYCICQLVVEYRSYFSDEHLKKWNLTRNMEPDKLGKSVVKEFLTEELGELYARNFYDEELKESVEDFCYKIIDSYSKVIESCEWLSEDGKKHMIEKLNHIVFFIGADEEHSIDPKDAEKIGAYSFETAKNLHRDQLAEMLALIGQPAEEAGFLMPAQTVNACYNVDNTVTLPFAIMHAPFYDKKADFYTNLGGLGMILCHEISHAFDSNCIAFDMNGNYRPDWISEQDKAAFEEKMEAVKSYYSNFSIMEVYHVDGELTLGENFADLGAMECLMKMATRTDQQRKIFENYANIWCQLSVSNYAIQYLSLDVHSPAQVRVNAVLSSCDEFYKVYDVKEGERMYLAPEERVSRW